MSEQLKKISKAINSTLDKLTRYLNEVSEQLNKDNMEFDVDSILEHYSRPKGVKSVTALSNTSYSLVLYLKVETGCSFNEVVEDHKTIQLYFKKGGALLIKNRETKIKLNRKQYYTINRGDEFELRCEDSEFLLILN